MSLQSHNIPAIQDQPTWPPNYSVYTTDDDEVYDVLLKEANSRRAPDSYKAFLRNVIQVMADLKRDSEKAETECSIYMNYVDTLNRNYNDLELLCKQERMDRIKAEEKILQVIEESKTKSVCLESPTIHPAQSQSNEIQHLTDQLNAAKEAHEATKLELAAITEKNTESTNILHRFAMARLKIEKTMVMQIKSFDTTSKKLAETQSELEVANATVTNLQLLIANRDSKITSYKSDLDRLKQAYRQMATFNSTQGQFSNLPSYIAATSQASSQPFYQSVPQQTQRMFQAQQALQQQALQQQQQQVQQQQQHIQQQQQTQQQQTQQQQTQQQQTQQQQLQQQQLQQQQHRDAYMQHKKRTNEHIQQQQQQSQRQAHQENDRHIHRTDDEQQNLQHHFSPLTSPTSSTYIIPPQNGYGQSPTQR
ncbi:hypothetical protein CLU79DRAFT_723403 [Phycomyces nitens]|nr:hypothetical protein CLU79DRAFT_723403 [Phycomyces nitens]